MKLPVAVVRMLVPALAVFGTMHAAESASTPRTSTVLGEVRLPGGEVYEVASAPGFAWPNLTQASEILHSLVAAEPKLALFARTFAPVPVQFVPVDEEGANRRIYIRHSVAVGHYLINLMVEASVRVESNTVASVGSPPYNLHWSACFVPPDSRQNGRVTPDEIGRNTRLNYDAMAEFCRGPEAYLRTHVPRDRLGQEAPLMGLAWSYQFDVGLEFNALNGRCPTARKIVTPNYPEPMTRARITGDVTFEATVHADGSVSDFAVVKASQREFTKPVEEAVAAWRFRPSLSGFGPRPEILNQLDRLWESPRPLRIRGIVRFMINER